jgi:hypothetical protein
MIHLSAMISEATMRKTFILAIATLLVVSLCARAQGTNGVQRIPLKTGWNLVSAYRTPQFNNLTMILTGINQNIAFLTKDGSKYYTSQRNFVGDWQTASAYYVYMNQVDTLNIYGYPIAMPFSVNLKSGWNLLAYVNSSEQNVATVLAGILDKVLIVTDGEGKFFMPPFQINTLVTMKPNKGYRIYVTTDCTLTFQ